METVTAVLSTFFTGATVTGRFYGQGSEHEYLFDVVVDDDGNPLIMVRARMPVEQEQFAMPAGACILVQLFEQPDVLWLASATHFNGGSVIRYAPIKPLESADGRVEMPALVAVSQVLVKEAVADRNLNKAASIKMIERTG